MRRAVAPALAGVALLLTASAVGAQPQTDGGTTPSADGSRPSHRGFPNVFISPSGEPFRSAAVSPYAATAWFRGADADADGRVTRAEFLRDAERFFRRLDTNGDGVIDGFEIRTYEEEVAPEILPRIGCLRSGEGEDTDLFHDRNGGVGRGGAHGEPNSAERTGGRERPSHIAASDKTFSGAGAFGVLNDPEPVQACDTDLDGKVSLAEWRAKAERRFSLLDAKASGFLSLDGLPKTYVQTERDREAAKRAKATMR